MAGAGKKGLTKATIKKYKMVVDEWFINDFNGTQAYKKYYPRVKDETATVNFSKLKEQPEIKAYIKDRRNQINEDSEMTQRDIVKNLEAFANMDVTEVCKINNGRLVIRNFDELTPEQRRAITGIKETKYGIEVEFFKKETAYNMLSKHKGVYEVDNMQKAATVNITTSSDKHKSLVQDILNGE